MRFHLRSGLRIQLTCTIPKIASAYGRLTDSLSDPLVGPWNLDTPNSLLVRVRNARACGLSGQQANTELTVKNYEEVASIYIVFGDDPDHVIATSKSVEMLSNHYGSPDETAKLPGFLNNQHPLAKH